MLSWVHFSANTYIQLQAKKKNHIKTLEKKQFIREQINKYYTNEKICRFDFLKSVIFTFLPATI